MDEVILFRSPSDLSHLIVFNLPSSIREASLVDVFKLYGPIFEVSIHSKPSPMDDSTILYYAFVKYYSQYDARTARLQLHQSVLPFSSKPIRVHFIKRTTPLKINPATIVLAFSKCVELANGLLGFNRWTSAIEFIRPYNPIDDCQLESKQDEALEWAQKNNYRYSYTCKVRLDFLDSDCPSFFHCGVFHSSPADGRDVERTAKDAKKKAATMAFRELFAGLAIIRLENGKIYVRKF